MLLSKIPLKNFFLKIPFFFYFLLLGCASAYLQSVGGESLQNFQKTYASDFNTVWQSILDALKNNQLDITNREGGFIQTRWTDNTAEKNFVSPSLGTDKYLKAQYRFHITAFKGYYNGKPVIKVDVQKEQLIQKDILEGWRPITTDSVDEMTLLYRIGRLIFTRTKIAKEQEENEKQELKASGF